MAVVRPDFMLTSWEKKDFNPELQLEDTESAIKSKLIELLTQF